MMTPSFKGFSAVALLGYCLLSPGHLPAQESPAREPSAQDSIIARPLSTTRSELDRSSEADLQALLQRVPGLQEVSIRVDAGVAFLSGTVLSVEDRALADSLVRSQPSVVYVDNRIREETSLRSRLGPMGDRLREKLLVGFAYLPLLLLAMAVVVGFFLFAGAVSRWDAPYRKIAKNPFLRTLLRQMAGGLTGLLGLLLALELLDATALVGAVLGAAGVVGVAVGFAFRNIAENYLAGIILSIRQPFFPDDHVLVEGQEGKIIRLTSRETILMTLDGNHVRVPNAKIFNSIILNYTRNPLRRFRFDLSVGQNEDLGRAQEIGLEALRGIEGILREPSPRSSIVEVGDSWVLLRFFGWADQEKTGFDKVRSESIRMTKEALDRAGVTMPAPEYGVRVMGALEGAGEPFPSVAAEREQEEEPALSDARFPETPAGSPTPDLSPDRELDRQIARDRQEAGERDLLHPSTGAGP